METYFNQRILQGIFQSMLLPWAQSDSLSLVLAEPGWAPPERITVTPQKSVPRTGARTQASSQRDASWSQYGLHYRNGPLLLFILDGEADIRVGRIVDRETNKHEIAVYSLPARSCLIIPPNVGHSDGSTPHWERPHLEKARSQILWMQILSTGVIVHICRTDAELHTHTSSLFVRDVQLFPLVDFMLERAVKTGRSDAVLSSFMQTLLLCAEQGRVLGGAPEHDAANISLASVTRPRVLGIGNDYHAEVMERASLYIRSHLTDSLSPESIARHACTSVSQLKRIFRAHLGVSVMKYVAQRRLEEAQALLLQTSLTTGQIGETCGYPHRAHFSRAFKEQTGASPLMFRRQATARGKGESP